MTKKKIYIAGKVTGLPIAECTMKFGAAQVAIEKLGHEAVNPLAVVNDWHCPWDVAMKKCINALLGCDIVLVLNNYKDSKGALLEIEIAKALKIPVFFEPQKITTAQKVY